MRLAEGSPQADLRPGRLPTLFCVEPKRKPHCTEIYFKPRTSPQAELRRGRLPTSRITTREDPHKQNYASPPKYTHTTAYFNCTSWGFLHIYVRGLFLDQRGPEREACRHTYIHTYMHTYIGLSGLFSASLGLSGHLQASLGLSGPLYIHMYIHTHTYIHGEDKTTHSCITDSWSPGPKLKTTQ